LGSRSIYHCGDSAYFDGFSHIGDSLPTEIALLPIGAYEPPTKREVHMNPEQAVRAFKELKAKLMIPMHYGSFRLSYEPVEEPVQRLRNEIARHKLEDAVMIMDEGVPVVF
jgi:L-ascorbate metabolism protein UlaG (beta-lactamase superfamily)